MTSILIPLPKNISKLESNPAYLAKFMMYKSKLENQGLSAVWAWPEMTQKEVDDLLRSCSGVLFAGGDDFDPMIFGERPHPKAILDEPARDILELALMKRIFDDKIPSLGICRGIQGMAIAAGGSLIQHLPDVTEEWHGDGNHNKVQQDILHEILISKNSRAFGIVGKEKIIVNSFHHQSVKVPGENFIVSGRSPGGVVELIESIDPEHFCFGIQSHPERLADSELENFFERFAEAVRRKMPQPESGVVSVRA